MEHRRNDFRVLMLEVTSRAAMASGNCGPQPHRFYGPARNQSEVEVQYTSIGCGFDTDTLALGLSEFLRQTFHEWAWLSTRQSDWAKSFYDQQRERKKSHHVAIRALAFKWLRILFRCWKDSVPYDATRYAVALQKRGQEKPEEIHWKDVAGFAKLARFSS